MFCYKTHNEHNKQEVISYYVNWLVNKLKGHTKASSV